LLLILGPDPANVHLRSFPDAMADVDPETDGPSAEQQAKY